MMTPPAGLGTPLQEQMEKRDEQAPMQEQMEKSDEQEQWHPWQSEEWEEVADWRHWGEERWAPHSEGGDMQGGDDTVPISTFGVAPAESRSRVPYDGQLEGDDASSAQSSCSQHQ